MRALDRFTSVIPPFLAHLDYWVSSNGYLRMPLQDQPLDISFWLNYHFHLGVSKFYLVCLCAFCAELTSTAVGQALSLGCGQLSNE